MRKVYVTGSSGVLGYEILRHLVAASVPVTGVARSPLPAGPDLPQHTVPDVLGGGWFPEDARDAAIVHCAGLSDARASYGSVPDLYAREVLPQAGFAEALAAKGWRGHLVYLSSAAIYGDPERLPIPETQLPAPKGFYALQKAAVEEALAFLARHHGFRLTILRVANPYGSSRPGSERGVMRLLLDALHGKRDFTIYGSGEGLRDYVHMSDFLTFLDLVLRTPQPDPVTVLNLGSGSGTSLNRLVELVSAAAGRPLRAGRAPSSLEVGSNVLDMRLARERLGWRPRVEIPEGVRRMAADYAAQTEAVE